MDNLETEPTFDDFWSLYPRKVARRYAEQCWNRLKLQQRVDAIKALPNHIRIWAAEGRDSTIIPHASTWLNGWRWEDELEEPQPVKKAVDKWWESEQATRAKGIELNIYPRGGESWQDFKGRIRAALSRLELSPSR